MIIRYTVENFLSFDKSQSISLAASQAYRHKDHIITIEKHKLLKSALIFGANASGKSNFIKSIDFAIHILKYNLDNVNLENKFFKLNKNNYKKPGVFQFDLLIDNKVYNYGFAISYFSKEIISEWLYLENECIFERNKNKKLGNYEIYTDIKLDIGDKKKFDVYIEEYKNFNNNLIFKKLFLSDIANRVSNNSLYFTHFCAIFNELNSILILFPDTKYISLANVPNDTNLKQNFEKLLSCFDTGIINIDKIDIEFDKIFLNLDDNSATKIKQHILNSVQQHKELNIRLKDTSFYITKNDQGNIIASKMLLNHGDNKFLFDCEEESDGTLRLFDFIPLFFGIKKYKTIIIDEIDRSLHNALTKKLFELFYKLTNNDNIQLIVSTHETSLIDLDFIRQDEIWFIEREEDHSSSLYSLNKFKLRYDKLAEKDYLLGKFGALPIFSQFIGVDNGE